MNSCLKLKLKANGAFLMFYRTSMQFFLLICSAGMSQIIHSHSENSLSLNWVK